MWSSWDQDSKESFISYFRKQFIFYVITELVPPPISEFPVAEAHFLFSFKGTFGVICWVLSNQCYQNCSQSRRSIKVPRTVLTSPLSFLPKPLHALRKCRAAAGLTGHPWTCHCSYPQDGRGANSPTPQTLQLVGGQGGGLWCLIYRQGVLHPPHHCPQTLALTPLPFSLTCLQNWRGRQRTMKMPQC